MKMEFPLWDLREDIAQKEGMLWCRSWSGVMPSQNLCMWEGKALVKHWSTNYETILAEKVYHLIMMKHICMMGCSTAQVIPKKLFQSRRLKRLRVWMVTGYFRSPPKIYQIIRNLLTGIRVTSTNTAWSIGHGGSITESVCLAVRQNYGTCDPQNPPLSFCIMLGTTVAMKGQHRKGYERVPVCTIRITGKMSVKQLILLVESVKWQLRKMKKLWIIPQTQVNWKVWNNYSKATLKAGQPLDDATCDDDINKMKIKTGSYYHHQSHLKVTLNIPNMKIPKHRPVMSHQTMIYCTQGLDVMTIQIA